MNKLNELLEVIYREFDPVETLSDRFEEIRAIADSIKKGYDFV